MGAYQVNEKIYDNSYVSSDIEYVWRTVNDNNLFDWRIDLSKIEILDQISFYEISEDGHKTEFEIKDKKILAFIL